MTSALLRINDLTVAFKTPRGEALAVNRLNLELNDGQILGIVGESGSGKSLTSLAIMGLLPGAVSRVEGSILFREDNLLAKTERQMRAIRGIEIAMIFQEPMTSLNPAYTIGNQLIETIRLHQRLCKKQAYARAIEMLKLVRIPSPDKRMRQYPHELSGGMRQRVMIAIALSCHPKILIADEPTTALDVTIQADIIDLLKELRDTLSMSIIMISHDLGAISEIADRVMVMYAGEAVEYGGVERIFSLPAHPYTRGLLRSIPSLSEKRRRLETIAGSVPAGGELPSGCAFHPRCPYRRPVCESDDPEWTASGDGGVKCWMHTKEWETADV